MITLTLPDGRIIDTDGGKAGDVIRRFDLNPYDILALRDTELLTEDDECRDGDVIRLYSIVHGG